MRLTVQIMVDTAAGKQTFARRAVEFHPRELPLIRRKSSLAAQHVLDILTAEEPAPHPAHKRRE